MNKATIPSWHLRCLMKDWRDSGLGLGQGSVLNRSCRVPGMILRALELETCASKIGRCRGGLDFFRPWIIHTPPSAGKDPTGGPGPWAPGSGFLCSQQRPENRLGHASHVRSALSLPQETQGFLTDAQAWLHLLPEPVAGQGALGRPALCFCSTSCYLWVWGKPLMSSESQFSPSHFLCLSTRGP